MNLLDKRTTTRIGLAMVPALFFLFSCEEPSEIGLDLNPNKGAVSTHYIEIPLETTQFYNDSILSALTVRTNPNNPREQTVSPIAIGRLNDPQFGELRATAYSNIGLPRTTSGIPAGARVDSVFLNLRSNNAFVGTDIADQQGLTVHRLQAPIQPTGSVTTEADGKTITNLEHRYYIFSSQEQAEQIGSLSFDTAAIDDQVLRIALDQAFAQELLNKIQENDSSFLNNQQAFDAFARGIAIVPGEENTFINNYNFAQSSISIFYQKNDTTRTLTFPLLPKSRENVRYYHYPTYFQLEADYSNTALSNVSPDMQGDQLIETTDNLLYFRTGVGLYPKIDFSALEDFISSDTLGAFVINQAVLEIDSIKAPSGNLPIPSQLRFFFTDTNNSPFTNVNGIDANINQYVSKQQDTLYNYRANLVIPVEQYIQTSDDRYLQGMIYPGSTALFSSFVTDPERIKLKIYYTSLKED